MPLGRALLPTSVKLIERFLTASRYLAFFPSFKLETSFHAQLSCSIFPLLWPKKCTSKSPPRLHSQWFETPSLCLASLTEDINFPTKKKTKNPQNSKPSQKSFSTKLNLKERALSDCRLARTCSPKLVCGYLGRILFRSLRTTWVIT